MSDEKPDGWVSPRWKQNMEEAGDCHLNLFKPQEGFRPVRLQFLDEPKPDGWIKCSERLPEEDGSYLVWPRGKYHGLEVWFTVESLTEKVEGKDEWRENVPPKSFYYTDEDPWSTWYFKIEPTHWMPLPAAPLDNENKKTGEV